MTPAAVQSPDLLLQAAIALLPVVVGGLLAILGGLIGPPIAHMLETRTRRREREIAKFEELYSTIHQHHYWLDGLLNKRAFGEAREDTPRPLARARALASMYFPSLKMQIQRLELASFTYEGWMAGAGSRRLSGATDKINDGFNDAYNAYLKVFSETENALDTFAATQLQATNG